MLQEELQVNTEMSFQDTNLRNWAKNINIIIRGNCGDVSIGIHMQQVQVVNIFLLLQHALQGRTTTDLNCKKHLLWS